MGQHDTTRRQLLQLGTSVAAYAAGAAIVAGGVAVAGEARSEAPSVSPALTRLIAQHARADAAIDRWYEATWNPAMAARRAADDAIKQRYAVEVTVPRADSLPEVARGPFTFSTANSYDVARCRGIVSIPAHKQNQGEDWQAVYRAARKIMAAVKSEERARASLERRYASLRLKEREDERWKPVMAASDAIKAFPVASLADMSAKLDFLERQGVRDGEADDLFDIVRADVARLSGEARA
jgi:hypothetical protein